MSDNGILENAEVHGNVMDPELEAQMAADEAAWAKQEGESRDGRDERGRFTSAKDGQERAADSGTEGDEQDVEGSAEVQTEASQKPDTKQQVSNTKIQKPNEQEPKPEVKAKPEAEVSGSNWAKDRDRRERSWKTLTEEKTKFQREREDFELQRQQFEAQQKQTQQVRRDERGFSATDYQTWAGQKAGEAQALQAQALQAENAGDFARAEQLQNQAAKLAGMVSEANRRAQGLQGGGVADVWRALAADLPESMDFNGDLNRELRATLKSNPQLLGDPMGPFRAAVQVGRKVLQATQTELAKARTEAAKVEGLTKQVAELTQQLQALRQKTGLPGGGAVLSRGGDSETNWDDLSVEEMERRLGAMP